MLYCTNYWLVSCPVSFSTSPSSTSTPGHTSLTRGCQGCLLLACYWELSLLWWRGTGVGQAVRACKSVYQPVSQPKDEISTSFYPQAVNSRRSSLSTGLSGCEQRRLLKTVDVAGCWWGCCGWGNLTKPRVNSLSDKSLSLLKNP
jgi:hypothetical protein